MSLTQEQAKENIELSSKQQEMRIRLAETAKILTTVLNDNDLVIQSAKFASDAHDKNIISFDFIFHPENKTTLFKSATNSDAINFANLFAAKFNAEISKQKSNNNTDLVDFLVKNKCTMYFPYRGYWDLNNIKQITIVADPIDNDDENMGNIVDLTGKKVTGTDVIVNDDYAQTNPTIIISPENPDAIRTESIAMIEPIDDGGTIYINPLNTRADFMKTDIGYKIKVSKFKFIGCEANDFESLFLGKLEVYFAINDPSNANVNNGNLIQTLSIDREDINNSAWISKSFTGISNWSIHEDDLTVYMYEWDDKGNSFEVGLSASISLKVDVPEVGEVGKSFTPTFKFTRKEDDDFIGRYTIDRDDFINQYLNNRELEMCNFITGYITVETYPNYEPSL